MILVREVIACLVLLALGVDPWSALAWSGAWIIFAD